MMNIPNLGSKESVGVVLKVTFQKESPKQSFPKATSETAIPRRSSKKVFKEISQYSQENVCVGVSF